MDHKLTTEYPRFGCAQNVFDSSELNTLLTMFKSLPQQLNETAVGETPKAYTNGIDAQHNFYDWLVSKVQNKIELATGIACNIYLAMYLDEFTPWSVHSDYDKGDAYPGHAFLIPTSWKGPIASRTHTVIFNEVYQGSRAEQHLLSLPIQYPSAEKLSDHLCSHIDKMLLHRLSLAMAVEWQIGNVIYWDRKLLHSSDNFVRCGITQKTAIVLFATL